MLRQRLSALRIRAESILFLQDLQPASYEIAKRIDLLVRQDNVQIAPSYFDVMRVAEGIEEIGVRANAPVQDLAMVLFLGEVYA